MPHEHDEYETYAAAERAPEYDAAREYEPAHDNAPNTESDTIDARLGGEKDEWPTEDRGESGYVFNGRDVIGSDGASWLAAWGESAENIALYDEMVSAFALGETIFQLPDHTEYRDDGETLYKTFMFLNEDGSVGYEIRPHDIWYANDNEPSLFDEEDEVDDEQDRNAPEPTAPDMPETAVDDARAAEATFVYAADDTAPVAEYAPIVEQAAGETEAAQERPAYVAEPRMQEEYIAPVVRETPAHVTELLASVTYHAETGTVERAPERERTETAPETTHVGVEHRHDMRDILDIIPNLPTYANRDMEPSAAVAPEMRAQVAPIPAVIVTETIVLAADVVTAPERAAAATERADNAPRSTGPVTKPAASRETLARPREQVIARTPASKKEPRMVLRPAARERTAETRREAPHRVQRAQGAPRMTEKTRGEFAQRPRREAARPAHAETRTASPETTHPLARIMRGRETVHPARQAANARRFAHAHSMNDNTAPHTSPSATLSGIMLHRAA